MFAIFIINLFKRRIFMQKERPWGFAPNPAKLRVCSHQLFLKKSSNFFSKSICTAFLPSLKGKVAGVSMTEGF